MAFTVNIHKAKSTLSELIQRVLSGEDVIIAKDGHPVVRLIPFTPETGIRPLPGIDSGKLRLMPDFDEPLNEFDEV
jgi:prevent-host-death family protein